jgi:hypothetical protein
MFMKIEFTIPLISALTVSESNRSNEHWLKKGKRHNLQKLLIKSYMMKHVHEINILPCLITMTRIAPRTLDSDNLVSSFKWFRDAIAEHFFPDLAIGRADDNERLTWEYAQEKGEPKQYAIRIKIESENTRQAK